MSQAPQVVLVRTPEEMIAHFIRERLERASTKATRLLKIAQRAEDLAWKAEVDEPSTMIAGPPFAAGEVRTTDGRRKPPSKLWKVGPSLLHGVGLFATVDVGCGEVVLSENPLLEMPLAVTLKDDEAASAAFMTIRQRVRAMTIEEKQALLSIMAANSSDFSASITTEELNRKLKKATTARSMMAKQLATTLAQHSYPFCAPADIRRLFRTVHLLNHSCDPNAEAVWNPDTGRLVVRAITEISATQEITVSYTDPYSTCGERWSALRFECNCTTCGEVDEALHKSDRLRRDVANALSVLRCWRTQLFGWADTDAQVSAVLAQYICARDAISDMLDAIKVVADYDIADAALVQCSDLALVPEMTYVCTMAQVALTANTVNKPRIIRNAHGYKLNQFQMLARTVGVEHPRTRHVLRRCVRMAKADKDAMKSVQEAVHEYGWDMEVTMLQQEPATDWDEGEMGGLLWSVVLDPQLGQLYASG
ncbi:hypothetical protein LTR85_001532 [Meristemomyces frigidus]|nr:hypothetical protein LTR85_001532 [Meristemomyces frigidus]